MLLAELALLGEPCPSTAAVDRREFVRACATRARSLALIQDLDERSGWGR
jgi:hypothetical protein